MWFLLTLPGCIQQVGESLVVHISSQFITLCGNHQFIWGHISPKVSIMQLFLHGNWCGLKLEEQSTAMWLLPTLLGYIWQVMGALGYTHKPNMHHTVCKQSVFMWPYSSKCRHVGHSLTKTGLLYCFHHCLGAYGKLGESLVAQTSSKCITLCANHMSMWGHTISTAGLIPLLLHDKWCSVI